MIIFLQILILFILLAFISLLSYSMIFGGPYAPIGDAKIKNMISLLNIKKGEKAVDIGSGDGRVVRALAHAGAEAHGYELNPLLVLIARIKIRRAGLQKKAFIHMTDMWRTNFSTYDIITVYLAPHIMSRLEKKLKKELKPKGRIAMNYYHFPKWKPTKQKDTIYLYTK